MKDSLDISTVPRLPTFVKPSRRSLVKARLSHYGVKWTLSAVVALVGGHIAGTSSQSKVRESIGYDMAEVAANIKNIEDTKLYKKMNPDNKGASNPRLETIPSATTLEKLKKIFDKVKTESKSILVSPEEYIKNTDIGLDIRLKYNKIIKLQDDVSYYLPLALITLILFYTLNKILTGLMQNPTKKKEAETLYRAINQIKDRVNILQQALIDQQNGQDKTTEIGDILSRDSDFINQLAQAVNDLDDRQD